MKPLKGLVVFLGFLFVPNFIFAQTIPTGKIIGSITDNENNPLPGVTITISSSALIAPVSTVSNEKGQYRFVSLPPGTYRTKFELEGFKTVIREGIVLRSDQTINMDIRMEQGKIAEEVLVIGESPMIDIQKTEVGVVVTQELIQSLPLRRDLSSIFNAVPGMFDRTAHGSDARSNNFVVDGVKMQDPVTGDPYQTVPWNAIEEVEVITSNQEARYGAVKGGMVSVITKSGGNDFSGSVNFYYRNKQLQSDNTKGTPLEGQFVGFRYQYQPGFTLGGPIKKDKVWFFVSLDYDNSSNYVSGFPAPANFGDPRPANAPVGQSSISPFAKITWQINKSNKLIFSGYYKSYRWDHRGASQWTVLDANVKEDTAVNIATLQWTNIVNSNFFFNLKGSWYSLHQYLLANNNLAPIVDYALDAVNRGGAGSDWWYLRRRAQFNGDATYFIDNLFGRHELRAGIDTEFAFDITDCAYYQDPRFDGVFPAGFKAVDIELWNGIPQWVWVGTEYKQKNNLVQVGGFIQDSWSPAEKLVLNLGFRYDYAQGYYPPQRSKATGDWVNEKRIKAIDFSMISPRLGLSYDFLGDGKALLKASYGRYYAPLLMIFYYFNNPNQRTSFSARLNPDWSVAYTTPPWSPGMTEVSSNLKSPYADELSVGLEYEIINNLSVGVNFLSKLEKNLIDDVERGHLDWAHYEQTGELIWTGYHPVYGIDPFSGDQVVFYEMDDDFGDYHFVFQNVPGIARKYRGLEFKVIKRMADRWSLNASYVWSRGVGILNTTRNQSTGFSGFYDDPNVMINAYGKLEHQREHLFRIQAVYMGPWGINLSGYYQFGSGEPYTRIIRTSEVGLGNLYQGRVSIFAEPRGSYKLPDQHLLDLRLEKTFNILKGQVGLQLDIYNVFNNNRATSVGNITNWNWFQDERGQSVYNIMAPRAFQLGLVYRF